MADWIDRLEADLPSLTGFVLPGGCELSARLHVARTVCRRAERAVIAAFDLREPAVARTVRWLNHLGDLLFVLARQASHRPAP
jgi:cob(I)alamin adenosyltransferase